MYKWAESPDYSGRYCGFESLTSSSPLTYWRKLLLIRDRSLFLAAPLSGPCRDSRQGEERQCGCGDVPVPVDGGGGQVSGGGGCATRDERSASPAPRLRERVIAGECQ